jgi:hypothetical protein
MAYLAGWAVVGGGGMRCAGEEGDAGRSEPREKVYSRFAESAWHPGSPAAYVGSRVRVPARGHCDDSIHVEVPIESDEMLLLLEREVLAVRVREIGQERRVG